MNVCMIVSISEYLKYYDVNMYTHNLQRLMRQLEVYLIVCPFVRPSVCLTVPRKKVKFIDCCWLHAPSFCFIFYRESYCFVEFHTSCIEFFYLVAEDDVEFSSVSYFSVEEIFLWTKRVQYVLADWGTHIKIVLYSSSVINSWSFFMDLYEYF